jgi:hypothetical protein
MWNEIDNISLVNSRKSEMRIRCDNCTIWLVVSQVSLNMHKVTTDTLKTPDRLTTTNYTDVNLHFFGILFPTCLHILQIASKEC